MDRSKKNGVKGQKKISISTNAENIMNKKLRTGVEDILRLNLKLENALNGETREIIKEGILTRNMKILFIEIILLVNLQLAQNQKPEL